MWEADDLFGAIERGDIGRVRDLIGESPELAAALAPDGASAILFARYRSRLDVVDALRSARGELSIFEAAALGDEKRLSALLSEDPSLAQVFALDGFTGLQLAAFFGQPACVRALLQAGADPNIAAQNGQQITALHAGVAGRNHDVCRLLLAGGADVNARQQGGWTPLHGAAQQGDTALAEMLLAAGADRGLTNDSGETPAATAAGAGHDAMPRLLE
jgi:ankyrin repeat protein